MEASKAKALKSRLQAGGRAISQEIRYEMPRSTSPERTAIDSRTLRSMLSTAQAAEYLGVSVVTLRLWVKQGKVKAHRSPGGRLLRFIVDELDDAHGDINR